MRLALGLAVLIAAVSPVLAQPRGPAPKRPPQAQPPQPPAPPPGFFPCRTEGEVCYIGVVTGPSQVAILFTNDPQSEGIEPKPVDVSSGDQPGQALDLAGSVGRAVMLTGSLDPKTGLTKAQVVDTAGPLLSFSIKAQLTGEEGAGGAAQRGGGKAPARRR
jgi:hypothetical protein